MDKPTVFIGSSSAGLSTAQLVQAELSDVAKVIVWDDPSFFSLGTGTFEQLNKGGNEFDFAVLLFTPDDPVIQTGQPKFKPRDNVIFEFGLFTGLLGRDRAFVMRPVDQSVHLLSDLAGVTVAELKLGPQGTYDVKVGCKKIANEIVSKGRRPRLEQELAVLYRLVNALTFPHYHDVHLPALTRGKISYRNPRETFDSVDDVIDFLGNLLTDYVFTQMRPSQLKLMRIYFAYYLGDGALIDGEDVKACWDKDSQGKEFAGEFVIGLANPTDIASEQNWRVGRAIEGFSEGLPNPCARRSSSTVDKMA